MIKPALLVRALHFKNKHSKLSILKTLKALTNHGLKPSKRTG